VSPAKSARLRVVVDGSNLATEGRVAPSFEQLDEAVTAFREENPGAEIIVVADATFEHRVATSERSRFTDASLAGDIVTPPAGAVGRGDAFILKIADRIGGVVLSNDSFQEFQDEYPWLFDVGRLIGGKPVRGVGWVFTPRVPVRSAKVTRTAKKLAVTLANGEKPTIGTTLTPVKAKKAPAKKVAKADKVVEKAAEKHEKAAEKHEKAPEKSERHAVKPATKATKKTAKTPSTAKKGPAKKATKIAKAPRKVAAVVMSEPPLPTPAPAVALKRGRQPVNPETDFALFKSTYRVGTKVPGEVTAFTSHGAVIRVTLKGEHHVECYAPTTLLGTPPPARARDVLKRGDQRSFRLVNVDSDRRIAELALV
jgi:Zc3h12a-like ribonuclease protein